ncbi:MAG: anaerobic ribonucleoside-triphosphate reductase activating protein [Tissierellia bacterium]|nr:anaerobic ribonucleoside-triphosphate reductase activating protein [Tissierellia bacterium]
MRYGQIRRYDVSNGPGIRTTIFVTGCTHKCKGCFNLEYQDFEYGEIWTEKTTETLIDYLNEELVEGLTILGGEPFQNTCELLSVIKEIRGQSDKAIWIYSGYRYETLVKDDIKNELLQICDILVDGLFIEDLKDLSLKFRGSSNQRIIDIKKSSVDNIVLLDV